MASTTQSDRVYDSLRAEILSCRMPPGSKIKIPDVCAAFEVSLGAAREALARLVSAALVDNEPQKGYRVKPVSQKELADLTRARIEIEGLCLRDAIRNGGVEWETQIVAAFHRLSRIDPRADADGTLLSDAWSEAHGRFHHALVAACDNAVLQRLRAALYFESERYRNWCLPLVGRREGRDVEAEHRAIMEAALARDEGRARALMDAHLQATTDMLMTSPVLAQAADPAQPRPQARARAKTGAGARSGSRSGAGAAAGAGAGGDSGAGSGAAAEAEAKARAGTAPPRRR